MLYNYYGFFKEKYKINTQHRFYILKIYFLKAIFVLEVVDYDPLNVSISGDNEVESGKHIIINSTVTGTGSKELVWESSDQSVAICYQGIVLGLKPGKTIIKAKCVEEATAYDTIEITVKKYNQEEVSETIRKSRFRRR